jgi:hypothetical protein
MKPSKPSKKTVEKVKKAVEKLTTNKNERNRNHTK